MAARTLILQCDNSIREILSRAITEFAHAAYPEGGSECAQVARYTLLNVAADIDAAIESDAGELTISRRIRPNVKAALDYHFDLIDAASGHGSSTQRALFAGLLKGEAVTLADLDAARAADTGDAVPKQEL
jgi:hypothetical protein